MIPLSRPDLTSLERGYIEEAIDSGQLACGEFNERFSQAFCDYLGVKHALPCSSGTLGLQICFEALHVLGYVTESPTHYIISDETFGATMNACCNGTEQCLLYPASTAIEHGIDCEVYVPCHIFGVAAPDFENCDISYEYMIEDACEALGGKHEGQYLGTFGRAGVFGGYPNKQVTMLGEGGVIVADDDSFALVCKKIINQGRLPGEPHTIVGTNARMTEVQAACGLGQIERIEEILAMRRDVANCYLENLDEEALANQGVVVPGKRESWFAFPLSISQENVRDDLQAKLTAHGIQSAVYFPRHKCFEGFLWEQRLCIPFYNRLPLEDVRRVCSLINRWAT